MTVNDMFRELKYAVEKNIRNTDKTIPYMGGTNYKKNMLERKIEKYRSDAEIDYELNVISKEIYEFEIEIADRMKKALDFFVIY